LRDLPQAQKANSYKLDVNRCLTRLGHRILTHVRGPEYPSPLRRRIISEAEDGDSVQHEKEIFFYLGSILHLLTEF